jgi:membrane associated rhomboid family serine protease
LIKKLKYQFKSATALNQLIYINIGVYLLIHIAYTLLFLFQHSDLNFIYWIGIPSSLGDFVFKPWTLFSYMFVHEGFYHILFNLLWLYFAGQIFLKYFNAKKLIRLYLLGGAGGGIFYLLAFNILPVFNNDSSVLIGASASVLAILFAVATYVPNYKINLMFIGAIPIKYIAIASIVIDVLSIPKGNAGGHIAHFGGALIGYLFIVQWRKGKDLTRIIDRMIELLKGIFFKKELKTVYRRHKNDDEFREDRAERSEKIDKILDKIAKSGYDSLSEEEKEYLFKNSKKM